MPIICRCTHCWDIGFVFDEDGRIVRCDCYLDNIRRRVERDQRIRARQQPLWPEKQPCPAIFWIHRLVLIGIGIIIGIGLDSL